MTMSPLTIGLVGFALTAGAATALALGPLPSRYSPAFQVCLRLAWLLPLLAAAVPAYWAGRSGLSVPEVCLAYSGVPAGLVLGVLMLALLRPLSAGRRHLDSDLDHDG